MQVKFRRTERCPLDLPLPAYATDGAAGLDLAAAEKTVIPPSRWAAVPTGFLIEIEVGYEGQVRPRSGLAARHGVTVLNAPGTIDSDYRGELKVLLINLGPEPFPIEVGHRIAQLVIAPAARATVVEADVLTETSRGHGGFGHTGR